jgi:peroxiredoxin
MMKNLILLTSIALVSPTLSSLSLAKENAVLADEDVAARVGEIWNAELDGRRDDEVRLATNLSAQAAPEWAKQWAQGAIRRIDGVGRTFELDLTSIDGRRVTSAELKGSTLVVLFWASWCAPCVQRLPKLKELYAKRDKLNLEIVGISWDTDPQSLRSFVSDHKIEWPIFGEASKPGIWGTRFGIGGLPYVLLVDKHGVLRHCGADESRLIESELPKLLSSESPNKSLQPTPTAVMPPAAQEITPAVGVAEH